MWSWERRISTDALLSVLTPSDAAVLRILTGGNP
jgi:hypothetical protein